MTTHYTRFFVMVLSLITIGLIGKAQAQSTGTQICGRECAQHPLLDQWSSSDSTNYDLLRTSCQKNNPGVRSMTPWGSNWSKLLGGDDKIPVVSIEANNQEFKEICSNLTVNSKPMIDLESGLENRRAVTYVHVGEPWVMDPAGWAFKNTADKNRFLANMAPNLVLHYRMYSINEKECDEKKAQNEEYAASLSKIQPSVTGFKMSENINPSITAVGNLLKHSQYCNPFNSTGFGLPVGFRVYDESSPNNRFYPLKPLVHDGLPVVTYSPVQKPFTTEDLSDPLRLIQICIENKTGTDLPGLSDPNLGEFWADATSGQETCIENAWVRIVP